MFVIASSLLTYFDKPFSFEISCYHFINMPSAKWFEAVTNIESQVLNYIISH